MIVYHCQRHANFGHVSAGKSKIPNICLQGPFLRLDPTSAKKKAYQEGGVFAWNKELFEIYEKTYQVNSLGTRVVRSIDTEDTKEGSQASSPPRLTCEVAAVGLAPPPSWGVGGGGRGKLRAHAHEPELTACW